MQNKQKKRGMAAGILLPMGLVCLFAFCSLTLALFGGQAYRQIQAEVDDSSSSVVAANYLRTKLGQAEGPDAVELRQQAGTTVLVITAGSEAPIETHIYMDSGVLREGYVMAGQSFSPASGMQIARLARCDFTLEADGLFTAEIESPAGTVTRACYALAKGGVL